MKCKQVLRTHVGLVRIKTINPKSLKTTEKV